MHSREPFLLLPWRWEVASPCTPAKWVRPLFWGHASIFLDMESRLLCFIFHSGHWLALREHAWTNSSWAPSHVKAQIWVYTWQKGSHPKSTGSLGGLAQRGSVPRTYGDRWCQTWGSTKLSLTLSTRPERGRDLTFPMESTSTGWMHGEILARVLVCFYEIIFPAWGK